MTNPATELARARIRYLGAFVRGEITDADLKRKLMMIERAEKRLETMGERLDRQRAATRDWRQRHKLERALRQSLEQPA